MPCDDSLGLEEKQALLPVWPQPTQDEPQQTIRLAQFGFVSLAPDHRELMPKRQVFEHQQAPGSAARKQ